MTTASGPDIQLGSLVTTNGVKLESFASAFSTLISDYCENCWVEGLSHYATSPWLMFAIDASSAAGALFGLNYEKPIQNALREETGLPVEMLATLTQVSRQRFHQWLRGEGVSDDKQQRMNTLLLVLRSVRQAQPDLRKFLQTPTPIGLPAEILAAGDDATVLGLARFARPLPAPNGLVHLTGIPRRTIDGRSAAYQNYNSYAAVDQRAEFESEEADIIPVGNIGIEA